MHRQGMGQMKGMAQGNDTMRMHRMGGMRPGMGMAMRPGMGMGMEMGREMGRMNQMGQFRGHSPMNGMRGNMWQGQRQGMRGMSPDFRMQRGMMRPMAMNHQGMGPMGPAGMIMESLPNVTEKQKKDIADLRQKQMDEMKKFREETDAKIKAMRESNKTRMMNILTDEQKKFIETKTGNKTAPATTTPAKVK
jgi:hypothetical protein